MFLLWSELTQHILSLSDRELCFLGFWFATDTERLQVIVLYSVLKFILMYILRRFCVCRFIIKSVVFSGFLGFLYCVFSSSVPVLTFPPLPIYTPALHQPRLPCSVPSVFPSHSAPLLSSCFFTSFPSPELLRPSPHLHLISSLVQLVFYSHVSVQSCWIICSVLFCLLAPLYPVPVSRIKIYSSSSCCLQSPAFGSTCSALLNILKQ